VPKPIIFVVVTTQELLPIIRFVMLDGTQAMTNLIENDKISKDQID